MRIALLWTLLLLALVAFASAQDAPNDSGEGAETDPDANGAETEENAEGDGTVNAGEGGFVEAMEAGDGAVAGPTGLQASLPPGVAPVSAASGAPSAAPGILRRPSVVPANASGSGSSDDVTVPGGLASASSTDGEQEKPSSAASSDSESVVTKPSSSPTSKPTSGGTAASLSSAPCLLVTTIVVFVCTL